MTTPRSLLVDPDSACDYHLASRCVQRAFLCGRDPHTGRDQSHRRRWLVDRVEALAPWFAVDVHAYTVMANHFHLVVRHDPLPLGGAADGGGAGGEPVHRLARRATYVKLQPEKTFPQACRG